MDAKSESPSDVRHIITRDLTGYTELLDLLHREKQLLVERDFDAFAEVLEKKHTLLLQLDQFTRQRLALLLSLKLDSNEGGMQALLDQQPEFGRDKLKSDWEAIKQLVKACNRQNEVNAKIAHRAQSTSRQVLNILKGAPLTAGLYGKQGTARDNGSGLSITRA
jgi:flagellar biosynthesis/type III secretory pathway chaperone